MSSIAANHSLCIQNLKRWEREERLRRKAARESNISTGPSFLQRGASLLWRKRKSVQAGAHRALNTSEVEDDVPLGEVGPSPCTSRATSPIPTTSGSVRRSHSPDKNPFSSPEDNLSSNSITKNTAVMDPSPEPLIVMTPKTAVAPDLVNGRPAIIQASSSFSKPYPAPQPIDIPPPRTPPPRALSSDSSRPPEPAVRAMSQSSSMKDESEELPQSRWWTEWLCGCTEGHDRGGDNQVNFPFLLFFFVSKPLNVGRTHESL